jgi:hypothetical protein
VPARLAVDEQRIRGRPADLPGRRLQLIEEQLHHSWGKTLVGETSVLDLHEGMHG